MARLMDAFVSFWNCVGTSRISSKVCECIRGIEKVLGLKYYNALQDPTIKLGRTVS